jgi:hypothetical protein
MSKVSRGFVAAGVLAVSALGLGPAKAATGNLPLSLCSPTLSFSARPAHPNPFYPLSSKLEGVLVGPDSDQIHGLQITLGRTRTVAGVTTRIVREFEWVDNNSDGDQDADEPTVEDSENYFAQTSAGTVCYFGESVKHYDDAGNFVPSDTSGSWLAGDPTPSNCDEQTVNQPGIWMPASPKPGMHFQQESAPCVALDVAQIVGVGTVSLSNGTSFSNAIRVKEGSLLESGKEYKAYASGVGLVIDDGLELCSAGVNCPGS